MSTSLSIAKYFGSKRLSGSFDFGRSNAPGNGNNGISFGMFQDFGDYGRFTFTIIAFIISVWLIWSSINLQRLSSIGYILIAGGALGNATDRIIHGKVIDFIDFHYLDMHWPAFNFADSFIFIGVALFLYNEFFLSKVTKK